MIRLFAALAVPADVGEALAERQSGLRGAHWRPLESLHLTLRFFDEVAETTADDLGAELSRASSRPLKVELAGAGAFDDGAGRPRAVWAGVTQNEALKTLARRCEAAARRAGLKPDKRAFFPHVTLAYLDRDADAVSTAAWIQANNLLRAGPFEATAFGLYSSRLGGEGSTYRLERLYRFSGA